MADLALSILLSATDTASGTIQQLGNTISSLASGNIMGAATTAATAIAGIGVASVSAAASFQQTMLQTQALAGVTAQDAQMAQQAIMQMATATGQTPQILAQGLYYIASAGYSAKDSLTLLDLSARAAAVGNTQTEVTANALTATLSAYGVNASQAAHYMDMMTASVSMGKTEFKDYASVIGIVAVNAKQANVSFAEATSAFSALTNVMASSKQAKDSLDALLQTSSRFDLLASRASNLNIAFDMTKYKTLDLEGRMRYLMEVTGGNTEKITTLLGRQNAMAALTALSANNFGMYNTALKSVTNSQGDLNAAFEKTSSGFNASMDRLKAGAQVLLITIGNQFLPVLTSAVNGLTPLITGLAQMGSSTSPLAPILSNISSMLKIMASNWADLASHSQPLVSAFMQFGQLLSGVMVGAITQFLRAVSIVNVVMVDIASAVSQWAVPALKILGQIFQGAVSAIAPILDAIDGQLVPAIHNLITAIAPVVQGILQWIASSGIIPFIMSAISIAIQIVVNVVSILVNILAALITFFTQNALGVAIFRAVLIVLAAAIAIIGVIILSVVIPAFVMWVAGAIAVGIANLIAFAPIILIVLAIIAVVTIVVLVITHWGDIAHWLQGVWSAVAAWFMSVMSAIGSFFVSVWGGISSFFVGVWNNIISFFHSAGSGVSSWWTGLWTGIQAGLQNAWNVIVNIVRIGAQILFMVIFGPIVAIVNLFNWLYQHNYYFKALVDSIRNFFVGLFAWLVNAWNVIVNAVVAAWQWLASTASSVWHAITSAISTAVSAVVSWLQSAWQAVISWLGSAWAAIAGVATSVWNAITTAISTAVQAVVSFLQGVWNNVVSWLTGVWNNLVSAATKLWVQISTVFGLAWNTYIAKPMQTIWDNLTKWASGLVTAALDWGKNLIQGFINGIMNMLGAVGNAASSVVSTIGKFLGFHSPTQLGPGAQADTWAPNFIQMFSKGLTDGTTDVAKSSQLLITQMQQTLQNGFTQLNATVTQGVQKMTQTLTTSWTQMTTATQFGMTKLQTTMTQGWTLITQSLLLNLNTITQQFTAWWVQIQALFTTQFTLLTTTINNWWIATKVLFTVQLLAFSLMFTLWWQQLQVLFTQQLQLLTVLITNWWTALKVLFTVQLLAFSLMLTQWWLKTQLLFTQQLLLLTTLWTNWWKQLNLLFTQQWQLLLQETQKGMLAILNYIKTQQTPITDAFVLPFKNAQAQIAIVMKAILDNVTATVGQIITQLNSIQTAAQAATTAVNSVPSAPSGGGSPIKALASGIENFGGGLAYVHSGEVLVNLARGTSVVPANRVSFGGGGGGGNVHYITINIPRGRNDARDIAKEVSSILKREYRSQLADISTGGGTSL
jgi:TP901 family phage tail tape measure protein